MSNMANEKELNLPNYTITAESDLSMVLLGGTEGIGQTYSTKLTYQQCADFFEVEDESIPERERVQRDAEKPRVKNIVTYLIERDNTVFSSACLIVTQLELDQILSGNVEVFNGILPAKADRVFIDGQGRLSGVKEAIVIRPEIAHHHLDVKVIVVPTKTVRESAAFVCQIFRDLNMAKKPNASQSIYFDSELSSSRLAKDLLDATAKIGFGEAVAVNGKIKKGQLYTLANFTDFIQIIIGEKNKAKLNEALTNQNTYQLYLKLITDIIKGFYAFLPLADIQKAPNHKEVQEECVLTCAIGFKALAYVGRSLIENMLVNEESELAIDNLKHIPNLPIHDRGNDVWIKKEVYQYIDEKLKIVRSSEKRLARILCHQMRVMPCEDLV
jgi:DNA sulfur modification protein DndB